MRQIHESELKKILFLLRHNEKTVVKISMKEVKLEGIDAVRYKMLSLLKAEKKDENSLITLILSIGLQQLTDIFANMSLNSMPLENMIKLKKILDELNKKGV